MRLTIIRMHTDLHQTMYIFYLIDNDNNRAKLRLVLDQYEDQQRLTKRHGWKSVRRYERLNSRTNNLARTDITVPDDVIQEALDYIRANITVE